MSEDNFDLQASSALPFNESGLSQFPPNTDPPPSQDIRAVLPRTFTREDLAWATKKAKQAADQKGEPITWSVAKQRAYGYFKAVCGAPPYDKTVVFAPPVKKEKAPTFGKKKSDRWWLVTMKTNRERTKVMKARMEILAKMNAPAFVEPGVPDGSD